MTIPHHEERARFSSVMAARTSAKELIGLFEKLGDSDKFSVFAKPYCFADLLECCAKRVPASSFDALLATLDAAWMGDALYRIYDKPDARARIAPFVRKVLEISLTKEEVLLRRMKALRLCGITAGDEDTIDLARQAGLPDTGLAKIRDALARQAAQPPLKLDCPF